MIGHKCVIPVDLFLDDFPPLIESNIIHTYVILQTDNQYDIIYCAKNKNKICDKYE